MEKWRENLGCSVGKLMDCVERSWNWPRFSVSTALTCTSTTRTVGSSTKVRKVCHWVDSLTKWKKHSKSCWQGFTWLRRANLLSTCRKPGADKQPNEPRDGPSFTEVPQRRNPRRWWLSWMRTPWTGNPGWPQPVIRFYANVKETPVCFVGRALLDSSILRQCYSRFHICRSDCMLHNLLGLRVHSDQHHVFIKFS